MEIAFLSNDPLESVVVDAETGDILYSISTPPSTGTRKTTIYDSRGQKLAQYKRRPVWEHDQVMLHGETKDVSDWLRRDGLFTNAKKFVAADGKWYVWKHLWGTSRMELVDCQTNQVVAKSHGARIGCSSTSRRMGIRVSPKATPFLDAILLSFIICEKKRREDATTAAIAGTSPQA
ncbi:hypothetical protein ONZ51_g5199 [Trametes cubensis]|uniref:DUF6593 domain-containing protein n=1 Tax=Trametes cubensis TaxID=1111947 RepID=A0AAD7XBB9_9APHY|nr:hypothetical protein ONZ51_g5199 [Trametes cubensis]